MVTIGGDILSESEPNAFRKSLEFDIANCYDEYPRYAFDFKKAFFHQAFDNYCAIRKQFPELDFYTICRIKSFHSTLQKASEKSLDRIYDIHGIRHILCSVNDDMNESTLISYCYRLQHFLEKYYKQTGICVIDDRTKDYIATPKENGYQAIHLSAYVPGESSRRFETQIKTEHMNEVAKYGLANHAAKYKPRNLGKHPTISVPSYSIIHEVGGHPVMDELSFEDCFQYFYNISYQDYKKRSELEKE